jgi:hypothetical protein
MAEQSNEETRRVFGPYHDGAAQVYGDPLEIYRALQRALGGQFRQVLKDARTTGPADAESDTEEQRQRKADARTVADGVAFPAIERLLAAVRVAFRMKPFDPATGQGALERDCHQALDDFLWFLSAEKKNGATSPTSAPPTA